VNDSQAVAQTGQGEALHSTDVPPPDSDVPVIFTVLQEQLGLRLESAAGLVDVFVIERITEPTDTDMERLLSGLV
jgi:uncharacterized protein (TIGR03435 family)